MSREQFEQAIKVRFGDSIDYRVCKNGDGEYMAWDTQVAWWAWQAASKASEQQLSESRREFTAANATIHNLGLKVCELESRTVTVKLPTTRFWAGMIECYEKADVITAIREAGGEIYND